MSKNIQGIPVIYEEEPRECELCHKFEECRPYGPKGEQICHDCAMKDPETTNKMMRKILFKDSPVQ